MIVNYLDVMNPVWEDRKKQRISNPTNLTPREYMKVILDAVNTQCKKGYRFNGIITSTNMHSGGVFLYEKSTNKYTYVWKFDDEIKKYSELQGRRGGIINDEQIVKLYEAMGNIHCMVYLPNVSDRLIFFIAVEEKGTTSSDNTLDLYQKYKAKTGKNAVWQGRETNGFIAWKDMYEHNKE